MGVSPGIYHLVALLVVVQCCKVRELTLVALLDWEVDP
jgi:hypothetical protein